MTSISNRLLQLINKSVETIIEEDLIEDCEFATVLGMERDVLSRRKKFSNPFDSGDLDTSITVLGNLVGYPHGKGGLVEKSTGFSTSEIKSALDELIKLREESIDTDNS